jgi:hypothetical protein
MEEAPLFALVPCLLAIMLAIEPWLAVPAIDQPLLCCTGCEAAIDPPKPEGLLAIDDTPPVGGGGREKDGVVPVVPSAPGRCPSDMPPIEELIEFMEPTALPKPPAPGGGDIVLLDW